MLIGQTEDRDNRRVREHWCEYWNTWRAVIKPNRMRNRNCDAQSASMSVGVYVCFKGGQRGGLLSLVPVSVVKYSMIMY